MPKGNSLPSSFFITGLTFWIVNTNAAGLPSTSAIKAKSGCRTIFRSLAMCRYSFVPIGTKPQFFSHASLYTSSVRSTSASQSSKLILRSFTPLRTAIFSATRTTRSGVGFCGSSSQCSRSLAFCMPHPSNRRS